MMRWDDAAKGNEILIKVDFQNILSQMLKWVKWVLFAANADN